MSSLTSDDTMFHPNHAKGKEAEDIMEKASNKEVSSQCYSTACNTLSPCMKVGPLCIAKNKSGKLPMCTDMSFGKPTPNDLFNRSQVSIQLDSLASFIPHMLNKRNAN